MPAVGESGLHGKRSSTKPIVHFGEREREKKQNTVEPAALSSKHKPTRVWGFFFSIKCGITCKSEKLFITDHSNRTTPVVRFARARWSQSCSFPNSTSTRVWANSLTKSTFATCPQAEQLIYAGFEENTATVVHLKKHGRTSRAFLIAKPDPQRWVQFHRSPQSKELVYAGIA